MGALQPSGMMRRTGERESSMLGPCETLSYPFPAEDPHIPPYLLGSLAFPGRPADPSTLTRDLPGGASAARVVSSLSP